MSLALYSNVAPTRWTLISVKLKIVKLFIREMSNIAEGEENIEGERPGTASTEEDEWESGDDEDWEDLGESRGSDNDDIDGREDLLKGVNTKVAYF